MRNSAVAILSNHLRFAMIYHLTKSKPRATKESSEPVPPPRGDSLPQEMAKVNFKPAE